jgi:hypothetical protein
VSRQTTEKDPYAPAESNQTCETPGCGLPKFHEGLCLDKDRTIRKRDFNPYENQNPYENKNQDSDFNRTSRTH